MRKTQVHVYFVNFVGVLEDDFSSCNKPSALVEICPQKQILARVDIGPTCAVLHMHSRYAITCVDSFIQSFKYIPQYNCVCVEEDMNRVCMCLYIFPDLLSARTWIRPSWQTFKVTHR